MDVKHVFVDYDDIDPGYGVDLTGYYPVGGSPYGIQIIQHKPKLIQEPVIDTDKEWDAWRAADGYMYQLSNGKYVDFYTALSHKPEWIMLCYAESDDGIHWTKPDLGLVEFNGNKHNNIVMMCGAPYLSHVDEGNIVYYDTHDTDESRRFKMLFTRVAYDKGVITDVSIYSCYSKDGFHWSEPKWAFKAGDCFGSFFYDEDLGKYIATYKPQFPGSVARRTLVLTESEDFDSWTTPRLIMHGDPTIPPDVDYYQTGMVKWPGAANAYALLIPCFHRTEDYVVTSLALSRDLQTFHFLNFDRPIVDISDIQGIQSNYFNGPCIVKDHKFINQYARFWGGHNGGGFGGNPPEGVSVNGTYLAVWREDGYTSLHSESHGGFTTVCHDIGEKILLNCEYGPKGYIKVELTDFKGEATYEGFTFDDCELEKVDEVHYEVKFKKPLSALPANTRFRLRVKMFKADLYSYTFVNAKSEKEEKAKIAYRV